MTEGRRFCENCGTEIRETTNFCPNCGAAQHPDPEVPTGPPPPTPEPGRISTPSDPDVPPPPERQEQSRGHAIRNIIIVLVLIILLVILIRGCGSGGGSRAGSSGESTTKSSNSQASGKTFTNENYGDLVADPDGNKGAKVDITGKVFTDPEVRGSQAALQIFADPKNSQWNTIVRTDPDSADVKRNDYVHVTGDVSGSFEGKNAFGASISGVEVKADGVEPVEAAEAVDPTQNSIEVGQTRQDQGFSVTVDKVDFGKDTTRVYISARNDTNAQADLHLYSAKLIQGSKQIDAEGVPGYDITKPQTDIGPGIETKGVVVFGPADPSTPFQLTFEWSSREFRVRAQPLVFEVPAS